MTSDGIANESRSEFTESEGELSHREELYYGITFKPSYNSYKKMCKTDPTWLAGTLVKIIADNHYKLFDSKIEYDSLGVQHIHATVVIPKSQFSQYPKKKGFYLYMERIHCLQRWLNYCRKLEIDQETQNSTTEYPFVPDTHKPFHDLP